MRTTAVVSTREQLDIDSDSESPKPRGSVKSVAAEVGTSLASELKTQGNKFVIRVPGTLRKRIMQISQRHHRSMNSEIILLLGRYFEQQRLQESGGIEPQEVLESRLSQKLNSLSAEKREALLALLE